MKWQGIRDVLLVVAQVAALLAAAIGGAAVGTVPLAQVAPGVCRVGAALAPSVRAEAAPRPFGS